MEVMEKCRIKGKNKFIAVKVLNQQATLIEQK